MSLQAYLNADSAVVPRLTDAIAREIKDEVVARINEQFSAADILSPAAETMARIRERIHELTKSALYRRQLAGIHLREEDELIRDIADSMLGLGFLERLLPPQRVDLSEVMLNQDGRIYGVIKGHAQPRRIESVRPTPAEVGLVLAKVLGAINRRVSEAEPVVSAKLPRSTRMPAGARVNVVAPPIANGDYPIVNIRLYEPEPVKPDRLLSWGMFSPEVLDFLASRIAAQARVLIAGGTGSGKTTTLAALANFIPQSERILLVEDPSEIFLEHPHVVSMEARPPSIEGKYGVSLGDLVTTAMRQTPKWLIVGEVRTGQAAVWLLRAQMSDHPGMSTIHADSPRSVVETLCLLAMLDLGIKFEATRTLISRALNLIVQIGFDRFGKRRVLEVVEVGREAKGDVALKPIFRYDEESSTADTPQWLKMV